MLTPKQKQRILTATGHYVKANDEPNVSHRFILFNGSNARIGYGKTKQAAWDSWETDANWCESELKAFVRELDGEDLTRFVMILFRVYMRRWGTAASTVRCWLEWNPELLCTAFDTFLLKRESK